MARTFATLIWDLLAFSVFVTFSILKPLWSRFFGKFQQKTKSDYVFATSGVSLFAMMLSIARGTLGIRSVLGFPSELFYYGSAMWETIYGMANAYPMVCFIFVPVYFNLGITSVYQYIDLRFKSRLVRCLASFTYLLRQSFSLGIAVYTPSVALSAVTGIPYWASIVSISLICIFFTVIGGLRAAIHADVIQTLTVVVVTLVIIAQGLYEAGGPKNVFNLNKENGRLKFFNFTGDMTVRVDTTSAWLGQLFMSMSQFGCQQNFMQRYVSLKSVKEVQKAMMLNIPLIFVFFSLSWLSGMVVYSTYFNCDPLKQGYIQKPDEILPFFIEDRLSYFPGFFGLFLATLFNGALSLNVSNLNSLSIVVWEDFACLLPKFRNLNEQQQLKMIKIITVIFGFATMGLAFGVGLFTGVVESAMIAFSTTSGPLLGVFLLAMLVPFANWKGASAGMIASHCVILWLFFGGRTVNKKKFMLETSTEGCSNFTFASDIIKLTNVTDFITIEQNIIESNWLLNMTRTTPNSSPVFSDNSSILLKMYSVSYMYYSLIGTLVTIVVAIIISGFTQTEKDCYDSGLLHPFVLKLYEKFPGAKPYITKEENKSEITSRSSPINKPTELVISEVDVDIQKNVNILTSQTNNLQHSIQRFRKIPET